MNDSVLPPRSASVNSGDNERLYRTALSTKDYLRLEVEAMERGLKPFGLTKTVMTLYVNKQLVYVKDLSPEIQAQIAAFYKKSVPTTV